MEQRLLGQDVTVRLVRDGLVVAEVVAIGNFDDSQDTEIKQEEFLGQTSAQFSEVFDGYSGNLEFQTAQAGWVVFATAIEDRATRKDPQAVFNVVRTDQYANGDSNIFVYKDVAWGPTASNIANRKEFAKHKLSFKCSERQVTTNSLV